MNVKIADQSNPESFLEYYIIDGIDYWFQMYSRYLTNNNITLLSPLLSNTDMSEAMLVTIA